MEVSRDEEECRYCHYEFPPEQKGTMAMAWAFIILIIIWLITRF
ncbi:hypothetical protein [Natronogracilivirga saccharolytica]|nr:hypothetical protein [Natronogracilivirga saccharolytica]